MNSPRPSPHLVDFYEDQYAELDPEWRRLSALGKASNIVTLCQDLPRRSVVEIGAGDGAILQRLSELNFGEAFYALEISSAAVSLIQRRGVPRLAECGIFDGYHVPYPDGRFDLAILSHVIEHVEHPRLLLNEASRIAAFVFVEVPLEDTLRLPREFGLGDVGHINFFSPKTLRLLVQSCGLRVVKQVTRNRPKATYTHQSGSRGAVNYLIKQALLNFVPAIATEIFTYHGALVCERSGPAV